MSAISVVVASAALAMIVVASVGLSGHLSLHSVSTGGLVTSIFSGNLPQFITSIVGLTGGTSVNVVSGVGLGFSLLNFMIASATICSKCCKA